MVQTLELSDVVGYRCGVSGGRRARPLKREVTSAPSLVGSHMHVGFMTLDLYPLACRMWTSNGKVSLICSKCHLT